MKIGRGTAGRAKKGRTETTPKKGNCKCINGRCVPGALQQKERPTEGKMIAVVGRGSKGRKQPKARKWSPGKTSGKPSGGASLKRKKGFGGKKRGRKIAEGEKKKKNQIKK